MTLASNRGRGRARRRRRRPRDRRGARARRARAGRRDRGHGADHEARRGDRRLRRRPGRLHRDDPRDDARRSRLRAARRPALRGRQHPRRGAAHVDLRADERDAAVRARARDPRASPQPWSADPELASGVNTVGGNVTNEAVAAALGKAAPAPLADAARRLNASPSARSCSSAAEPSASRSRRSRPTARSSKRSPSPTATSNAAAHGRRPTRRPTSDRARASTRRDPASIAALAREVGADMVMNACDPRLNRAIFTAAFERPHHVRRHGDDPVGPAPRRRRTELVGPAARPGAVRALRRTGSAPACSRSSGWASSRALRRLRPLRRRSPLLRRSTTIDVRDGADLIVEGYAFAPTFSIWTTIEECLNPPIVYERGRGHYTTEPFSEPEVFEFPEGHRAARVRQRRARGSAPHPALDRLQPGDVQVRPRRRSSSTCCACSTRSASTATSPVDVGDVAVSPRDVVAACLPDPARLGDRMQGKTCAGTYVTGTGPDGAATRGVPVPRRRQRGLDGSATVARRSRGRPRSIPSSRSSCSRRAPGPAPACSARRRSTRCRSSTLLAEYGSPHGMEEREPVDP